MVVCEVCRKTLGSSDRKVQCSGECAKFFHPFCADLNLSYWKALAAKVGLLWFCTKCRAKVGSKEKKSTDCFKGVDKTEEKVEAAALELLPEEVWIKVFRSLSGYQLRQVRMTCRSWNQIVGSSSSLMGKLVLRLPKDSILDQDCEEAELLATWSSRYSHMVMEQLRIIRVDSWWPSLVENLETLSITKSQITIDTLLTMLEPLHNLKNLTFSCGPFVDARGCPAKLNFKLPSLEELVLQDVDQGDLLDVFRKLCPQLKVFKLTTGNWVQNHPQKVVQLIEAVKRTLESVELPMVHQLWNSINAINGICLKVISLTECKDEQLTMKEAHIITLSQKHPNLEAFLMSSTACYNTGLETIGRNLPNLKHLKISPQTRTDPVSSLYLRQMLELVRLDVNGNHRYYGSTFDFTNCRNNSLKILHLNGLQVLQSYSNSFPYISHLSIANCKFTSWSHIFDSQLKCLQSVTLKSVRIEKNEECLAAHFESLTILSIAECNLSKSLAMAIFSLCPNLTEVQLANIDEVDDAVVLTMCRKLKKLRKITITGCRKATKLAREYVDKHGDRLEFKLIRIDEIPCRTYASYSSDSDDCYNYSS